MIVEQWTQLQDSDVDSLLYSIQDKYGYAFQEYVRTSIRRRIGKFIQDEHLSSIQDVERYVIQDPEAMDRLLEVLSISVTSMFRDPDFFMAFRTKAITRLKTYPYLRFWVAGCSTGEEALSLAIILHEHDLLERSRIYATDISPQNLRNANSGIIPLRSMTENTRNYVLSGGRRDFSNYYSAKFEHVIFRGFLRRRISYAQHNLVADKSFNEFHVIFCRNVMIYFAKSLQERVMHLFFESLTSCGFLGLGSRESIVPGTLAERCKEVERGTRLFQVAK